MTKRGWPQSARHKGVLRGSQAREPRSVLKLVEQMEKDYQFRLGYLVIESLVRSASMEVDVSTPSADDSTRTTLLAQHLKSTWSSLLPSAMRAFAYGRAAFEKTYRYDRGNNLVLLAGLDYLPPDKTELVLNAQGGFGGIELRGSDGMVRLEPERTWWFALDPTLTEPHGRSRYAGAPYAVWQARRQLEEQERIWFAKFALGHGVARAPDAPAGTDSSADPASDPMEAMRRELASIESGGILILSSRTGPDGRYLYDYQATSGAMESGPLERRREMLDVAALRSLGIPERAITQNDRSGSRAMAQVHLEVLYRTCEGILDQILHSFEKYVARPLVAWNWPEENRPTIQLRYRPIGETSGADAAPLASNTLAPAALTFRRASLSGLGVVGLGKSGTS